VFLIGPEAFTATGKILDDVVASTGGLVSKLKMASSLLCSSLLPLVVVAVILAVAGTPRLLPTRGDF